MIYGGRIGTFVLLLLIFPIFYKFGKVPASNFYEALINTNLANYDI